MVANNWSEPLLRIQKRVNDAHNFANAGKFELAVFAIRSIERYVMRTIMALEAEQARRKELEVKR